MELLRPDAEAPSGQHVALSSRVNAIDGRVFTVVNNSWRAMDIISAHLVGRLREHGAVKVIEERLSVTARVSDARLDELAAQSSVAIVGLGNCGSCTAWTLHEAIELERRGVPTVALCTQAYEALAKMVCRGKGISGLPLVVLPHPLNDQTEEFIHRAVDEKLPEIFAGLTTGKTIQNAA